MVKLPRSFAFIMKILFAFAVLLAAAQLGLGLTGVAIGLVRGQCSSEAGTAAIDPQGNVVEGSYSSEQCEANPAVVALGSIVAAGGVLALGGLTLGSRRPSPAMGAVIGGAVLGLPLGYTIVLGVVPLFLAAFGALAIYLASQERQHVPTGLPS
jgi:hypothetical protein